MISLLWDNKETKKELDNPYEKQSCDMIKRIEIEKVRGQEEVTKG